MVRVGKDKKRRAGRTGRTKLKNRSYRRWNPKPAFSDPIIKRKWDPSKSPAQNMQQLGLVAEPNPSGQSAATIQESMKQPYDNGGSSVIELYEVPESDTPKQKRPQSEEDQKYICRCLLKHGDDYVAMFRDIKTNNMQHTETKLRKMASRFFLLDPEQRVVEVPEKVKHLVQS